MEPLAEMTCNLKVNIHCDICKRKIMQVLQNLHGVYSVVINSEKGTVDVTGKVNPNIILRILDKNGKHAEFSCLEFHGQVEKNNYYNSYVENDPCYYYGDHVYIPPRAPYPHPMLRPEFSYPERYPQFIPLPPMPRMPPLPPMPRMPLPPPSSPPPPPLLPLPPLPPQPPMPPRPPPPRPPPPAVRGPSSVAPQAKAAPPSQKPKCCIIM